MLLFFVCPSVCQPVKSLKQFKTKLFHTRLFYGSKNDFVESKKTRKISYFKVARAPNKLFDGLKWSVLNENTKKCKSSKCLPPKKLSVLL